MVKKLMVMMMLMMSVVCMAHADMACDAIDVRENMGDGYTIISVRDECVTVNAMAEDGELVCSVLMVDGDVWVVFVADRFDDDLAQAWIDECVDYAFTMAHELWGFEMD